MFLFSFTSLTWWILLTTFTASVSIEIVTATCNRPQTPDHASLIFERHSNPPAILPNGYTVRVVCDEPYQLVGQGNGFMTCRNGQWGKTFSCTDTAETTETTETAKTTDTAETTCSRPKQIENGQTIVSSTVVGGLTTFRCRSGFRLVGNLEIVCQGNGEWNGSIPFCDNIRPNPFKNEFGGDIFFVFDSSKSVGAENFHRSKRFAEELIRQIGVTSHPNSLRVGALYFARWAHIAFHTLAFVSTSEVIQHGIKKIPYIGFSTNIWEALRLVREVMVPVSHYREGSLRTVVIMTDGEGNYGGSPLSEVMYLEAIGVKIYCVCVSENAISERLTMCSQPYKEHVFLQRDYRSMFTMLSQVMGESADSMYSECGVSENTVSRGRVVGGNDANPGAWPWQVLLEKTTPSGARYLYGGTLIDRMWVLTSAALVSSCPECNITAVLGITDLNEPRNQSVIVEERIPHPEYDSNTYRNNIALLKLRTPADLNANVRMVCLPNKDKADRLIPANPSNVQAAVITGWGHTGERQVHDVSLVYAENRLQQLALPLRSREDCRISLEGTPEEHFFDESMFCAGYKNIPLGACTGDTGGPLVKREFRQGQRRWTIIGLASWRRGCAVRNELDFFTNVPYFMDWIKRSMNSQ